MSLPPYLPFLDGPAQVAPKLKPISVADWLPPDTRKAEWLEQKRQLMRDRKAEVFAAFDWASDASDEAANLVFSHLRGVDPGRSTSQRTSLDAICQLVSDDLCVMVERDGLFCLGAASLCTPTFWKLADKAGKPLGGLHDEVPGGDPELSSRISRIFTGLQPGIVLERFNWTVQLGGERFTPSSQPMKDALAEMTSDEAADRLCLRVERQTIRKLPTTGAVLFTIRILVDPLPPILSDPEVCAAFQESWAGTDPALQVYKGWPHYEAAVQSLLARQA